MKKTGIIAIILAALTISCTEQVDYTQYVDTLIGTDYTGNTYPGAQVPFGMVQLSPDNGLPGWDRIAGYFYPDSTIAGFSHTHLSGTGCGDLYDISFMPVTLPCQVGDEPLGIYSKFRHDTEIATAGYYAVTLEDYDIRVELTATPRCGIQRYTFPASDSAAIYLNLAKAMNWDATQDSKIEIIDSTTICGYRYSTGWARDQKIYFYTRFSRPFGSYEIDTTAVSDGYGYIARFDYATTADEEIIVSTAISGVSVDGAKANLLAEAADDDFDAKREAARVLWNNELSKIKVQSDDPSRLTTFYTAMYHSMIAPTIYCDVDGKYFGPDDKVHEAEGWTNYSTFSLWDTYRAAMPLYTIINPAADNDMIRSFIAFADQNGRLPVWNFYASETDMMIGYHAAACIADAYLKGIRDFDADHALDLCVKTANLDQYRGIGYYKQLGFVPYDIVDEYNSDNWSMSRTLEYAFDDSCISQLAMALGSDSLANVFAQRAQYYRNTFNAETGWMQPRASDGEFITPFNPDEYTPHICESNGWQYYWSVQHDIPGLIDLTGGPERFEERLDSMFTYTPSDVDLPIFSTGMIGQYAQGNEPGHHVAYLYNYIGKPAKTAKYVNQILTSFYTDQPDGLCGNEDCGQMSAWYVLSAMGFYPVDPCSSYYEIGSPLFPSVSINDGKFKIIAKGLSPTAIYVRSVKYNGKEYKLSSITHQMIMDGGTLELEMTDEPAEPWYEQD